MIREMTPRGRNLAFLSYIGEALQLNRIDQIRDWRVIKRACTPDAVRKIHEGVIELWPDEDDYRSILEAERGKESGIYIGSYEPDFVMRGITRHSIYSDAIMLFDPFLDARVLATAYNPILHPEKFRTTTLRNIYLWLSLAPWIEAGLVKFLPSPTDFDAGLARETNRLQEEKIRKHPEIIDAMDEPSSLREQLADFYRTFNLMHTPDDTLAANLREAASQPSEETIAAFIRDVHEIRDHHPYYLPGSLGHGSDAGEIIFDSTGASFPIAKLVAQAAGAHLLTDLPSKWREVEIDRKESGVESDKWTPFAKAFQSVDLRYLEKVPLEAALTLRKEERLGGMRTFLRKVWKESRRDDEFHESNAIELAGELREKVVEAEVEWNQIDRDLAKWVGGEAAISAAVGVATGNFLSAAPFVIGGIVHLASARWERKDFDRRHPAAFFMRLKQKQR